LEESLTKIETFESSLKKLEKTVEQLEQGDLSLEEALASFEEKVRAAGNCQKLLSAAELKIEKLRINETGDVIRETFSEEIDRE